MLANNTVTWLNGLPAPARAAWLRWQRARLDYNRGRGNPLAVYELRQAYFAALESEKD